MRLRGWTDGMNEAADEETGEDDEQELEGEGKYKALIW